MSTQPKSPEYDKWATLHVLAEKTEPNDVVPISAMICLATCAIIPDGPPWMRLVFGAGILVALIINRVTHAKTQQKARDGPPDAGRDARDQAADGRSP